MEYLYVNSFIKTKSKTLFDQRQYQILEQSLKEDFVKVLCDLGYGLTYTNQSLDNVLKQEEEKLIKELNLIISDSLILKCYKFLHDITNIKIIYKNHYFLKLKEIQIDDLGNYSLNALESAIIHNNFDYVSEDKNLFMDLNQKVIGLNPKDLSDLITKECYEHLYNNYICGKDEALENFFKLRVTILNILLLYRAYRLSLNSNDLSKMVIENGLIDKSELIKIFNENNLELFKKVKLFIPLSFEKVMENNTIDITNLNDKFEEVFLDKMIDFETNDLSFGPIISYLYKKKIEFKKIKKIYFSKK